MYRRIYH